MAQIPEVMIPVNADTSELEKKIAGLRLQLSDLEGSKKKAFNVGSFLAESDGTPSASRLISFIASLMLLAIYFIRYLKTGVVPTPLEMGAGMAGANAAYAFNQARRGMESLGARQGGGDEGK